MHQTLSNPLHQTIEHLFRHESGKILAVLTKIFGKHNIALAEDVMQETLLRAFEQWKISGLPDNPSAWLMQVAKNKAIDVIRREKHRQEFAKESSILLKSEYTLKSTIDKLMEESEIKDDLLKMMFACCHPSINAEAQITLILKILCGFSTIEIAKAFLTSEESITKRLYRAKQQFREDKIALAIPSPAEIKERLENVLTAVYLLFNEGYNATEGQLLIRQDLVEEAMRLIFLLTENTQTAQPQVFALLALMCFHASRFRGRLGEQGNILTLKNQNRELWDKNLINQGVVFLQKSSEGENISRYHIEAIIAYEHCIALSYAQTNWKQILQCYDWLYALEKDPIVALNRAVVIGEMQGAKQAIQEISNIPELKSLEKFYLLHAILGELHAQLGEENVAKKHWKEAMALTRAGAEKEFLEKKILEMP
jgi:RNA polymerase sigma factor (sigma-70 family)